MGTHRGPWPGLFPCPALPEQSEHRGAPRAGGHNPALPPLLLSSCPGRPQRTLWGSCLLCSRPAPRDRAEEASLQPSQAVAAACCVAWDKGLSGTHPSDSPLLPFPSLFQMSLPHRSTALPAPQVRCTVTTEKFQRGLSQVVSSKSFCRSLVSSVCVSSQQVSRHASVQT